MASPFRHRGIVEGFYGRPFEDTDRRWLIERMRDWRMNTYVYAPKDDPWHRERWRDPYPAEALAELGRLVEFADRQSVRLGFAIAPGLSIEYASEADRKALHEKLEAFVVRGARFFCLALDDVPSRLVHEGDRSAFASLADAHVALANEVRGRLPDDSTLWLVPTDYAGTADSPYLETLGAGLDEAIEVGWCGRSVVSPEIRAEEARARSRCLGRRLLVWDNYPVADGPMRRVLHLGPYRGRAPDLSEHVSGLLLNPMEHPRASAMGLATAAAYMADPAGYAPERAHADAVHEIGAGAPEAFGHFAAAHRFSALAPSDRDSALEDGLRSLRDAMTRSDEAGAVAALAGVRHAVETRSRVRAELEDGLTDRRLASEIEPWIASHETETRIIAEAVDLLAVLAANAPSMEVALAFFRMEGRMTRIPPASHISYGPRRLVYPQLESLEDEGARFGEDPVLFLDHCLTEEIVRFAESRALARLGGRERSDRGA